MNQNIINKETGAIRLEDGFLVTKETQLEGLLAHFGKDKITRSKFDKACYFLPQLKMENYYIRFFFFFTAENLRKIGFEVETEPIKRIPWSSNRDVETKWIAEQMDDKSNFIWDMRKSGRHYHLHYEWGSIGVYYDFKNGTFDSYLVYELPKIN